MVLKIIKVLMPIHYLQKQLQLIPILKLLLTKLLIQHIKDIFWNDKIINSNNEDSPQKKYESKNEKNFEDVKDKIISNDSLNKNNKEKYKNKEIKSDESTKGQKNFKKPEDLKMKKQNDELPKNERPIAVIFSSTDQQIHYAISCYKSDIFSTIVNELYEEYPKLKSKNIYFIAGGNAIDMSLTLEQNKIKNSTTILINYID